MRLRGKLTARVQRAKLYELLTDPNEIIKFIPGSLEVKISSPSDFMIFLRPASGPLSGDGSLHFVVRRRAPPISADFLLEGTAADSTIDALLSVWLDDAGIGNSTVRWTALVQLKGRIASLEEEERTKMIEDIVSRLLKRVRERTTEETRRQKFLEVANAR